MGEYSNLKIGFNTPKGKMPGVQLKKLQIVFIICSGISKGCSASHHVLSEAPVVGKDVHEGEGHCEGAE